MDQLSEKLDVWYPTTPKGVAPGTGMHQERQEIGALTDPRKLQKKTPDGQGRNVRFVCGSQFCYYDRAKMECD